ncbi:MAG: Uma2 family endonuclease [Planctomycetes bacterium]|nr:Uma2 family endonuclease [Planctomycetota bacterium]
MPKVIAAPVIVFRSEGIEIPAGIVNLDRFRAWAHSRGFPQRGRIDWVGGTMEVDMSPEDLGTHGTPKSAIAIRLGQLIEDEERGAVFIDRARLTNRAAGLSCEPDVLVVLDETFESGRARLVPRKSGGEGRFIEIEGTADLVVEIVSDDSQTKDTVSLRDAYHRAGVREYWLIDVREGEIEFHLLVHGKARYRASRPDPAGFRRSPVLGREVRLVLSRKAAGLAHYRLEAR